jgi:hypothetical protein
MTHQRNAHATPDSQRRRALRRGVRRLLFAAVAVIALVSFYLFTGGSAPDASRRAATASTQSAPRTTAQARDAYGQLSLSFEANRGQVGKGVDFLARGAGYTLALSPTEAVFALTRRDKNGLAASVRRETDAVSDSRPESSSAVLRMNLVGANGGASVEGLNELEGKVNYLIGKDATRWQTDIPTFGRVRYAEVYPGIDVVYYGNQKQLEYDFVVAPGSEARAIALEFAGAERVEVEAATGDLLLSMREAIVRQPKPFIYQEVAGVRRSVEGGYVLDEAGRVRFALGEYDAALPLVIDPVLVYSTYIGGNDSDEARDIAVDSSGNAYICGETASTNFPTVSALDATFGGGQFAGSRDAFVMKLNAAGTALVYSTYLGGSGDPVNTNINGDDRCFGLAVDSAGNAYVAGETHSQDFPLANAIQATYGGGLSDAFLAKLNADGSALVFSTFIGGDIFDAGGAVALDSANNIYITGRTTSSNFPTLNPFQASYSGGPGADAFVTKVNAAGTALVYSTYLGGNGGGGFENGAGIAVDSAGSAYVTGQTSSTNFPTLNPVQAAFGGGTPDGDAFVTKLNTAGTALVYSTYLGGSDNDTGQDIAVDSSGNAHIAGSTFSSNFPQANAFDSMFSGTQDGFVVKLSATGTAFVYSTYFGGSGSDATNDIALDSSGNTYVVGGTNSTDLPTVNPIQGTNGGGAADAFATKFNPAGTALLFSTYFGGSGFDRANTLALDSAGSIYVAGITISTDFPTLSPIQATNGGGSQDGFVIKISDPPPPVISLGQSSYVVGEGGTVVAINVMRSGDISQPSTVSYATSDTFGLNECSNVTGVASARCDYTISIGKLTFAAGEQLKTINVSIVDDSYADSVETFNFTLSAPTGATLGATATATITITDNDLSTGANPLDGVDFFIRQHYLDFMGREPEAAGLQGWRDILNNCPQGNTTCDRIEVSSSFFRSEEFQTRGYFIYRFYSTLGRIPHYMEFISDYSRVSGFISAAQLEANKVAFVNEFIARPEFQTKYGALTDPTAFVDALLQTVGLPDHPSRAAWIAGLTNATMTRAQVVRALVDSTELYNKYYNEAFVVMQYFGYLRRDPDILYLQWIQTLNNNSGNYRIMISGFLNSLEYRRRFGPSN